MNILIISREEIPGYIEYYLQKNNVKLFYAKGSIKCQCILKETPINYILFFVGKNIEKILDDILTVINQTTIPVIVCAKQKLNNLALTNYYSSIALAKNADEVISELDLYLNNLNNKNTRKTKEISNLIFKNFFKKILKKKILSNTNQKSSLSLSSNLDVSVNEKNELLKNLKKLTKRK